MVSVGDQTRLPYFGLVSERSQIRELGKNSLPLMSLTPVSLEAIFLSTPEAAGFTKEHLLPKESPFCQRQCEL